jgi:hypothetical protein
MPKPDRGQADRNTEPTPSTDVQYLLVGTLIGAILLLIVFSLLSTST